MPTFRERLQAFLASDTGDDDPPASAPAPEPQPAPVADPPQQQPPAAPPPAPAPAAGPEPAPAPSIDAQIQAGIAAGVAQALEQMRVTSGPPADPAPAESNILDRLINNPKDVSDADVDKAWDDGTIQRLMNERANARTEARI